MVLGSTASMAFCQNCNIERMSVVTGTSSSTSSQTVTATRYCCTTKELTYHTIRITVTHICSSCGQFMGNYETVSVKNNKQP